jgi:prepilin-type N-terminal cleavage/methylation domain-containing protein
MTRLPHAKPASHPRAFTLLEVIVVITILAIMATLAVPRMTGNEKRHFRLAVEQTADLLTMYGQRQNLGQKVIGLSYDRTRHSLQLMVLDTPDGLSGQTAHWRADTYVKPVRLPAFILDEDVQVVANGQIIDIGEYPLSSEIGQERPWIELHLRGAGEHAMIALPPYGVSPVIHSSFMPSTGVMRSKYDLDSVGRGREDW